MIDGLCNRDVASQLRIEKQQFKDNVGRSHSMFNARNIARRVALAGAFPLLLASTVLAQDYYPRTDQPVVTSRGFANRIVEGTVVGLWQNAG